MLRRSRRLHYRQNSRSFVDARVKWVRDPYLDNVVEREKNLKPLLSLKNLILSSPSNAFPLSAASAAKPFLSLPTAAAKFIDRYPSVFRQFQPHPGALAHVRLTPPALALHRQETALHDSPDHRKEAAERLVKFLMLAKARKLPFSVIDRFRYDLGLPHNYVTTLLPDFPDFLGVCSLPGCGDGAEVLGLELVYWREDLAVSASEKMAMGGSFGVRKGMRLPFPMQLPKGFDLQKKVKDWVAEWQDLPYISPYENAFHLGPSSDQAEKWAVAVLHELLHLLVSKKTEKENLYCLGDYLAFGVRFKRALSHHPGIFYVSNKISTQTVVLREAYQKDFLVLKHPLMGMRHRYIYLMSKSKKRHNTVLASAKLKKAVVLSSKHGKERAEDDGGKIEPVMELSGSS